MSVSSIYNPQYYGNSNLWSLDITTGKNGKSHAANQASSPSQSAAARKNSSPYHGMAVNQLALALSSVLDEMNLGSNSKVSFQTLMSYRDSLQEDFSSKVQEDLKKLGVDENVSFRLVSDSDGSGVKVISDHEDRALIEKYFKDNPDMVKKFEQIQSLNKMEETRKSQKIDVKAIRSRLQVESMTAWYADTSSFMSFTQQGAMLHSGINTLA